jgi:GNAT superfamily N-acetyltransferase
VGRNTADFHGVEITHTNSGMFGSLVSANHPEHGYIGHLALYGTGTVRDIAVHPEWQRKGIATAMWNHAKANGLEPKHSPVRTDDGRAWSAKVGD